MRDICPPSPTGRGPGRGEPNGSIVPCGTYPTPLPVGEGMITYFTATVIGSEKAIRPEGPERPPGGSSSLPVFISSGSSVP
jgi:hypothetical protein